MENRKTLSEIVKEKFLGPVSLRCVETKDNNGTVSTCLRPADDETREKLLDIFELENLPRIFQVGAFFPKAAKTYDCFVRLRPRIIEAIPDKRSSLTRTGEWQPMPILSPFDLVFEKDQDRWMARHPKTSQYIQAFDMQFEASDDGKAQVPAGTIALRPACTRTFWIAGNPETIKAISDHAIEAFQEQEKEDFSYAAQFRLFGRYFTAFEVMGDPMVGFKDMSSFESNIGLAISSFEQWTSKKLLPVLHPDSIGQRQLKARTYTQTLDLADETRNSAEACVKWFRRWAQNFCGEIHRRRAAGALSTLHVPLPVGRKPRENFRLIGLDREDIEKMLFRLGKRTTVKRENPKRESKTTPTVKPTTEVESAAAKKTTAKPPRLNASVNDLDPEGTKKLATLAGKNGKVAAVCNNDECAATSRISPRNIGQSRCKKCNKGTLVEA